LKPALAAAACAAALVCAAEQTPAHAQTASSFERYGRAASARARLAPEKPVGGYGWNRPLSGAARGAPASGHRVNNPARAATAHQIERLLAEKTARRLRISAALSRAERAASRAAMVAAMRLILDMQANGVLPAGAARAFAAHGTMSVSHDVSGWSRQKHNFNVNIREVQLHLRNDSTYPGISAVQIAGDIIHDGWHALQHREGRSPARQGFRSDPGGDGRKGGRADRFNRIVVANEREANAGEIEFYRAVPGLPDYVREHLIESTDAPSDQDLLNRYRGRHRTSGRKTGTPKGRQ
jgi:hypothetical protein